MTQFSNTIAETQYAKKASQYINILNDLRRIGAHSAVDLPTVVFCGNQSAGKSSLLEAISNVQLPRSEGTCARCVMELRLIELEVEWSCQISLRQEYNGKGKRFSQPTEVKFGSLIKSHKEVELMARRAQKALLNPSKNSDEFLNWNFGTRYNGDDANTNELKFTKNVVCLEIKGKNVPNLSLIDLPGIIHHTEKAEDRKFIDLIKELVKEYIKKEQSIIIATITCRDEIDNQAIVTLAKEADPAGRRTLGVLTKPDTIERGTHDIWLKILRGEAHKLSLGYYVVKNPDKEQLDNQTFEQAREYEENFFESRDPWKDFMSDRIGVKKLRHKLSELLIQAIKRDLPKISKDAGEKLEEVRQELVKVPEKLGENSKIEIYKMVKKCVNKINDETSASSGSHKLWQMINAKFNEFNKNLFLSRPIFVIGKRSTKFDLLKDEVCTPQTLQIHQQISQPISTLNDVPQTPQILQFPQRNSFSYGCQDLEDQEDQEEQKDTLKMITEQQITELIISARGRLLPGFIPYSSAMTIIKDTQFEWKSPSLECLDGIYDIMFNFVHDVINETFSRFPLLHGEMKRLVTKWLDDCKETTIKYINFMTEMEINQPFTLDDASITSSKSSFRKRLIEILKGEGSKPTDATDIIASLLAYFKIAFKRYADTIAMTIIHAFIDEFTKRIEEKLVEICVNDDEGFDIGELIQEDHNVSFHREDLHTRKKHLKNVLDSLRKFGIK